MRYKKIVLSIIASVLCLGLLSGCGGYSHDFNSSEEAQKYVLAKLKDKYNEEFTIKEVKKFLVKKILLKLLLYMHEILVFLRMVIMFITILMK